MKLRPAIGSVGPDVAPIHAHARRREMRARRPGDIHSENQTNRPAARVNAAVRRPAPDCAWRARPFAQQPGHLNPTANPPDPNSAPVRQLAGWRRLALWPLGLLVRCWGRTIRFEISEEDRRDITWSEQPVALVLWHNRLFLAAEIFRRYRRRPVYALVSASQDGAWLAAFFSVIGMPSVRGSTNQYAREAARALITTLRTGHDIGITPDGPRGPKYDFKGGAFIVTRRAGAPVLLLGGRFRSAWRLKSWDGFYLPRPFSTVQIHCTCIPAAEICARETTVELLRERLLAINPD